MADVVDVNDAPDVADFVRLVGAVDCPCGSTDRIIGPDACIPGLQAVCVGCRSVLASWPGGDLSTPNMIS